MTRKLPKGWRRVRLGEVLEAVERVEAVNPRATYRLLGVRWYANGCHLHSETPGAQLKTKILSRVRAGDVTYNKMWTSKGAFAVVGEKQDGFAATSEYPLFAPQNGALLPDYLAQVFGRRSFWEAARSLCRGTTQRARLNPKDFLKLEVTLPPLTDQRRIVDALGVMDGAIRANEEVLERTRAFKKALAHDLLTRGLPGRHQRFKDSPLGKIPAEWEVKRLGEVLEGIEAGRSPKCEDCPAGPDEWGVLKVSAVTGETFNEDENKALNDVRDTDFAKEVKNGDVLMTRGNGSAELVARPVIVSNVRPRLLLSDLIYRLNPKEGLLRPGFLVMALKGQPVRKQIEIRLRGTSGIHKISKSSLLEIAIPCPPLDEQSEISLIIDSWRSAAESEVRLQQEAHVVHRRLRDALLAGALGGAA